MMSSQIFYSEIINNIEKDPLGLKFFEFEKKNVEFHCLNNMMLEKKLRTGYYFLYSTVEGRFVR